MDQESLSSKKKYTKYFVLEKAKDTQGQAIVSAQSEQIVTTSQIFRTAHTEDKRSRPAHRFESKIDCLELNGLDTGRVLHSNIACVKIQKYIAVEINFKNDGTVECASRRSLLLDKSTLNKKTGLIT